MQLHCHMWLMATVLDDVHSAELYYSGIAYDGLNSLGCQEGDLSGVEENTSPCINHTLL